MTEYTNILALSPAEFRKLTDGLDTACSTGSISIAVRRDGSLHVLSPHNEAWTLHWLLNAALTMPAPHLMVH